MECSICTEAINETTSSARIICGHTFHFGCLATWATKAQTCPMCRRGFGETETITPLETDFPTLWINTTAGSGRQGVLESMYEALNSPNPHPGLGRRQMWRPRIRRELEERYARRDAEDYPNGTDPIDIDLIVDQTGVSQETAARYLAYYQGDVVETVMCFLASDGENPIPEFQRRERPPLSEPYVSRDIGNRIGITALTMQSIHESGYESV